MTDDNRNNVNVDYKGNGAEETIKGCCSGCRQGCAEFVVECGKVKDQIMQVNCREYCKETCTVDNVKKKLPITKWLPKYRLNHLQGDLIGGLTVGLTVIPQGLAYAVIAELPPQYGLYSAFMGCFVYCILGTSKDITLGPTAIMSLMTAIFASYQFPEAYNHLTEEEKKNVTDVFNPIIAIVMTFFCGIVQFLMGVLNIGFLVEFIPHPVINSFTTAAAITIACGQIKNLLGLHDIPREFIHQMIETLKHIPQTNVWDLVMGLVCMLFLFAMKRMKQITWSETENVNIVVLIFRKVIWLIGTARNAIVIAVATGVAAIIHSHGIDKLTLCGSIQPGLPPLALPQLSYTLYNVSAEVSNITLTAEDIFKNIGSGFGIVPLIGLVETIAIGKAFARKNKYRIDANQELIAIGVGNTLGSFVGSYPITGSFSRTAVNSQSGVRTPAGGIFTGVLVILALALLTKLFFYIPNAALAGVIIMAVIDMVDFTMLKRMWIIKKLDLLAWFATFIFSFVLGIEYGIIIGIGVSLLFLLYPWSRPRVQLNKDYCLASDSASTAVSKEVLVIELDQGIRFPGVDYLRQQLVDQASDGGEREEGRPVVLDFGHVAGIDFSSVHGLEEILEEFAVMNSKIVLSNVQPSVLSVLKAAKLRALEIYKSNDEAVLAIQQNASYQEITINESTPLNQETEEKDVKPKENGRESGEPSPV